MVRKCSSRIRASDNVHVAKNSPISVVSPPCSYNISSRLLKNRRDKHHALFSWLRIARLFFDVTGHTRIMTVLINSRQLVVLFCLEVLNLFCYVLLVLSNKFAIRVQNSSNINEKGNCGWDPFFPQAPLIEKIVDPPLKLSLHTNKPPSPLCWSDSQWYFLERNLRELSALLVVLSLPVRCFLPVTVLTQIMIKSSFLDSHISITGNCKSVFFVQVHMHMQDCLKSLSNSTG